MMASRSSSAAMTAALLILAAGPAEAQRTSPAPVPAAAVLDDEDRLLPAAAPAAARGRRLGVMPIAGNVELGVGRFGVTEIARPRTHMEADRFPTEVRRRDSGIAGMGLKLRF